MDCIYWQYIPISQSLPGKLTNWGRASEVWGWATSTASTRGTAPSLGTLGRTLTSPSNGQTNDRYLLIKPQQLWKEEKYFMNQNHLKRDVNVPHGKAATETLMLTVVSLASDDPGPELGTRRGGGEGVTMLRARSDARQWRPGRRQSRSMSVSRSGARERDVTTSYNILTCFQNLVWSEEIL